MVLQNYVMLETGIPARMHFTDHNIVVKEITDAITGGGTTRNALVFEVDHLNGKQVRAQFSTLAEKLAIEFKPYLDDKSYRNYDVVITRHGSQFRTSYTVQFLPRK